MSLKYAFKEEFLNWLGVVKSDVDTSLIYLIHVLQSKQTGDDAKLAFRDKLSTIGSELSAYLSSVKVDEINEYNVRETERASIAKFEEIHRDIERLVSTIKAKGDVIIDSGHLFSISDIVEALDASKIHGDRAMTKDKVDKLLSIKRFILKVYESQVDLEEKKGDQLAKDFQRVKEEAFKQALAGAACKNAEYFFRSVEIMKLNNKSGKPVRIVGLGDDGATSDCVSFKVEGENAVAYSFQHNGLQLRGSIRKSPSGGGIAYDIAGDMEKGATKLTFSISAKARVDNVEKFERISGIGYVWSQFEKSYVDYQHSIDDATAREEARNKGVIDKAIDDILFGAP